MPIFGIEFFVSSYFNLRLFSWNIRFGRLIALYCTLIFRKCLFDYSIKIENFDRSSDINALVSSVWRKIDVFPKNNVNSSTIKSWFMQIKPSKSRRVELMSPWNFLDGNSIDIILQVVKKLNPNKFGYDLFRYHATVKWWKRVRPLKIFLPRTYSSQFHVNLKSFDEYRGSVA